MSSDYPTLLSSSVSPATVNRSFSCPVEETTVVNGLDDNYIAVSTSHPTSGDTRTIANNNATATTTSSSAVSISSTSNDKTTTAPGSSSHLYQQIFEHQQNQIIHYPAEFMQLGKRKHYEDNDGAVQQQPTEKQFNASSTLESTSLNPTKTTACSNILDNNNILDNEAGLSLLFAASLLQQQQQHQQQQENTISDRCHNMTTTIPIQTIETNDRGCSWAKQQQQQMKGTILDDNGSSELAFSNCSSSQLEMKEVCDWIEPRENDVLCGRGGGINKHYGNIMYRRVVEYNKRVYKQVPKRHRMLVSRSIVHTILNAGGRFLQQQQQQQPEQNGSNDSNNNDNDVVTKNGWTTIQLRRAVQKTSQALRERSCGSNDEDNEDEESLSVEL